MIPLTTYLPIVENYIEKFEAVFSKEELAQFSRYLSGLITGVNKTVDGINRLFILDLQNQCTLNRFLTSSNFDVSELNKARLNWLQECPQMSFEKKQNLSKPSKGVLIIDDTLLTHYGCHFEGVAKLYDHVNQNYTWAHCLVNLHYSDDQTDYPIDFKIWKAADLQEVERVLRQMGCKFSEEKLQLKETSPSKWRKYLLNKYNRKKENPLKGTTLERVHKSKIDLTIDLLEQFYQQYPQLDIPIAFDNWYTCSELCQYINDRQKSYVGSLDQDECILLEKPISCKDFTQHLVIKHQQAIAKGKTGLFKKVGIHYKGKKENYYAYCKTHTIKKLGTQRLVISFKNEDLSDKEPKYYISNRLHWRSGGILRIRRHRWPIEVYHGEGKAQGLDQYQIRKIEAIEKHIACVCVSYSILKRVQFDNNFLNKLKWKPKKKTRSLRFWRRVMMANALIQLIHWTNQGTPLPENMIEKISTAFL